MHKGGILFSNVLTWLYLKTITDGNDETDLNKPIIEGEEERPVKQVSNSSFSNRHISNTTPTQEICQKITRFVYHVSLFFWFLYTRRLAPMTWSMGYKLRLIKINVQIWPSLYPLSFHHSRLPVVSCTVNKYNSNMGWIESQLSIGQTSL